MSAAMEISPEDRARAHAYALIGRLFYQAPDAAVVTYILDQPAADGTAPLGQAWDELQAACRDFDATQVQQEYDDLFVSVGKAPVTLYTASYVAPGTPDRHLLALRETLDSIGLARRADVGETEDHLSGVCDVMRWLIERRAGLAAERRVFFDYLSPAVEPLCSAIEANAAAQYYRSVAGSLQAFHDVERAAFEFDHASE